jgi:cytosine/adenosine deaminase-related metal-dependent hydrolase
MEKPPRVDDSRQYCFAGATLVTPSEVLRKADLTIAGRRIVDRRVTGGRQPDDRRTAHPSQQAEAYYIDSRDHLIFPGLINAHDHLNGTWWPRVAPNRPYTNVYQWLNDLHTSSVRTARQQNSVDDIYELGVYRNLVSGVTTVADHFWRIDGPEFYTRFPIDVLCEYGRTWTPREPMGWGDDVRTEYDLAVRTRQPYIIHLAEGVDQETAQEMDVLLAANALGRNTMVIHGISLRPKDMQEMSRVGASVCWCPSSNLYLYGQTANIPALLDAGINIALGTDSSLSGGTNILDELRTARRFARQHWITCRATSGDGSRYDTGWTARWLVESITTRAAYALLRENHSGRIAVGYDADLLILPDGGGDPYTTLIDADIGDIALLCRAGVPIYGDPVYRPLFEQLTPSYTSVLVGHPGYLSPGAPSEDRPPAKTKLIVGDPLALLDRLSRAAGYTIQFPFLPLSSPTSSETAPSRSATR